MEMPRKEKKKKDKRSPETLSAGKHAAIVEDEEKNTAKGKRSLNSSARAIILRSIASYLDGNGFTRIAASLCAEAPVEVSNDKSSYLNLEEILFRYVESSDQDRSKDDLPNVQGLNTDIIATHEAGNDIRVSGKMISKKRTKQRETYADSEQDGTKSEHNSKEIIDAMGKSQTRFKEKKEKEIGNCSTESYDISNNKKILKKLNYSGDAVDKELKFDVKNSDNTYTKDKKKKKSCSYLFGEDPAKNSLELASETLESVVQGNLIPENLANCNDSKKKKHKRISDHSDDHAQCSDHTRDKVKELKYSGNYTTGAAPGEPNNNSKGERKRRKATTDETFMENDEQLKPVASKQVIDTVHKKPMDNTESSLVDKGSNKNKKKLGKVASQSLHCENLDQFDDTIYVDAKKKCIPDRLTHVGLKKCDSGYDNLDGAGKMSKKRKILPAEGACLIAGDGIAKEDPEVVTKSEVAQANGDTDTSIEDVDPQNKNKRKTGNNKDNFNKLLGELSNKTSAPTNVAETDEQFLREAVGGPEMANGNLNGKIDRTSSNVKRNENLSYETTTVNAFKRVKVDEVEFADERLQDNSYWAKNGAESGYGARAQEIFGQVKGSDFRHQKTKKKRGTYRGGGQIDLESHSIKFNYSDGE